MRSYDELLTALAGADVAVPVGEIYAHYKTPESRYQIKGYAIREADDSVLVLYAPVSEPYVVFARPIDEFVEEIGGVLRFQHIET